MPKKLTIQEYTIAYAKVQSEFIQKMRELQDEYQEKLKKLGEDYTNGRH